MPAQFAVSIKKLWDEQLEGSVKGQTLYKLWNKIIYVCRGNNHPEFKVQNICMVLSVNKVLYKWGRWMEISTVFK